MNDCRHIARHPGELKQHLNAKLSEDRVQYYGRVRPEWIEYANEYHWDETQQEFRLKALKSHGILPGVHQVCDLASGCGQFVLLALEQGYNCVGVEPEKWKIEFVRRKIDVFERPPEWKTMFYESVGENLPFEKDTFDYVTSFQTLEHVKDPMKTIKEMVRITKMGGAIHIMCPDYRSTFEAHYQLPWLPLFPRSLAKVYLRIMGRPTKGLDMIQYVTRPKIVKWIRKIEDGKRCTLIDENRIDFENGLRRRGIPLLPGAYFLWLMFQSMISIGRREMSIRLFIRVVGK